MAMQVMQLSLREADGLEELALYLKCFVDTQAEMLETPSRLRQANLFRVEYKTVSLFTSTLLELLQTVALQQAFDEHLQMKKEGSNLSSVFESVARLTLVLVKHIIDGCLDSSQNGSDAMQNLFDVLLQDVVVLLSNEVNGAPLEAPIFVLLLKTLCVQLIDLANKTEETVNSAKRLFVLDSIRILIIPLYQLLRRQERLKKKTCFCLRATKEATHQCPKCQRETCLNCFQRSPCIICNDVCQLAFASQARFLREHQSIYADFSAAHAFICLRQLDALPVADVEARRQVTLELEDLCRFSRDTSRRVSGAQMPVNCEVARLHTTLAICESELSDLFSGMKGTLLCMSYARQATIKQRCMTVIKQLIRENPRDMLADQAVTQIIRERLQDPSAITRESALDLLLKNLEDLASDEYVAMVIDRAHFDKNVTVRKKIIQILS